MEVIEKKEKREREFHKTSPVLIPSNHTHRGWFLPPNDEVPPSFVRDILLF